MRGNVESDSRLVLPLYEQDAGLVIVYKKVNDPGVHHYSELASLGRVSDICRI
jgi:hypothetical protein